MNMRHNWRIPPEHPSICASKKPKLLTQQASPTHFVSKTGNRRTAIDLDQSFERRRVKALVPPFQISNMV
jgi:hypothetical protein